MIINNIFLPTTHCLSKVKGLFSNGIAIGFFFVNRDDNPEN